MTQTYSSTTPVPFQHNMTRGNRVEINTLKNKTLTLQSATHFRPRFKLSEICSKPTSVNYSLAAIKDKVPCSNN